MFKKFNWGHGVIIALGSFIIFILALIFIFSRGWQNAELVSNNYYQDELNYQQVINAKKGADQLAEKPVYEQTKENIKLTFPKSIIPDDSKVNFELFRTDDANLDVKKQLILDPENAITIPKKILVAGSYTFKVKWQQNKKPYQLDYDVQWK